MEIKNSSPSTKARSKILRTLSYHIYTTRGIVLSYRLRGEADRVYSILTRDFGLVRATALGVRKEASKLRGALEPITLASISLVKGKDHWRLTSAEEIQRLAGRALYKPLALLEQLVPGESINVGLYEAMEQRVLYPEESEMVEVKTVAEILFYLGYLSEEDVNLPKKVLVEKINKGIQASQLIKAS